jgi:hypothetical protein
MSSEEDERTWRRQFEEMGANQVRARLLEWYGGLKASAIRWLAEKDQEAARLEEVSRVAQIEAAREAAASAALSTRLARTNNRIAMAALIIAILAVAISIASIFMKL